MLHYFLHLCRRLLVRVGKLIACLTPKDKQLILFSAWFGQKYIDSSMYMYEFCLDNNTFKPVWYTRNKTIYQELKSKGKPVVYSRTFKALIYQLRAKMLVSSVQFFDFNPYFLGKCIYFDLDHGFPIKQSGYELPDITPRRIKYDDLLKKNIEYYMSASSEWIKDICVRCYYMNPKNVAFCNKPRTDVLFDPTLRLGKNTIVDQIKKNMKAIIYMPTQRSAGAVKLEMDKLLDFDRVQNFCEKHNCVFIIKKHFYHKNETENLDLYSRIFDITSEDIDPETLTYQADILISDYSAAFIDYLLLDRPIIFYMFDLDDFLKKERDLYLKFEEINAGYKAISKDELYSALEIVCDTWTDDVHYTGRMEIRKKYFDDNISIGNARADIVSIMNEMINGTYISKWR